MLGYDVNNTIGENRPVTKSPQLSIPHPSAPPSQTLTSKASLPNTPVKPVSSDTRICICIKYPLDSMF